MVVMDRVIAVLEKLCGVEPDRRPGSGGNEEAVQFVAGMLRNSGWDVTLPEFACLNWHGEEGFATIGTETVHLVPSPYGLGVDATGPVRVVGTAHGLARTDLAGSVLIVTGDLVAEPLTPKAYPFYRSDEHTAIIQALEAIRPAVIIAVTGKHPELCGALDPFPWIEDGDFEIPAAAVRPSAAAALFESDGKSARVSIQATRVPSTARNVIARQGPAGPRVTVCAHIDTKPGTPGAVDNATGVAALILLAERLGQHDSLPIGVELLAVNGEDHFAGPGEVAWLAENDGHLNDIELFVNIDGAGYRRGRTAFSLYNVGEQRSATIRDGFEAFDDLFEGPAWYQSDHAILAMQGRPALAFTTEHIEEMLIKLFHAETDTIREVAPQRITSLAAALESLIMDW
jgi:aminopeptidase YwaD